MSNLRNTIEALASQFAASVVEALRGASLDEVLSVAQSGGAGGAGGAGGGGRGARRAARSVAAEPARETSAPRGRRGRGGRLGRRSAEDISRMVDSIVELLGKNASGLRAEQIRDALGVEAKELPRPLADALAAGRVTKSGQKRATTYFAGSGGGARGRKAGGRKKR